MRSRRLPGQWGTNCYVRWLPAFRVECCPLSHARPDLLWKQEKKMKNKCVLVTGATKGIGWAISQRLADLGCHVVGLARHTQDIDFPGYLYPCDLANAGETEEVLRVIREKYPVDAIVNNVGALDHSPLGEIELSQLYNAFDIHVRVAVQVTQAFVASMKARREGRVVNVCGH